MQIGHRLRELRKSKNMSQGDVERVTGLLRCYTSRVENGLTIPSVQTLEKYAIALEVPLYELFHEGNDRIRKPEFPPTSADSSLWGSRRKERRELRGFAKALSRMSAHERKLLFWMATLMARSPQR